MKELERKIETDLIEHIKIQCEDRIPGFLANYLIDWLDEYISSGVTIKDDETLQFGFSLLKFSVSNKILYVDGPDYKSIPFEWTRDLTKTLLVFKEQKYTIESFELNSEYAKLQNTVLVGKEFEKEPVILRRDEPSNNNSNDSGWFIGSLKEEIDNNDPKNLSVKSLYEVVLKQPKALPYLFFPKDSVIIFENENIEIIKDDYYLEPKKGSYIDKKAANNV